MDKLYEFEKFPENIRQIGEPEKKGRIYFEDYVVTYMERLFRKSAEKAVLVFLGKEGKGECGGCYFIYGAVELDFDLMDTEEFFSADKWEKVHGYKKTYFPDSQILGWGIGIRMETRALKNRIKEFHKKHFPKPFQFLYICNQGEETKSVYSFDGLSMKRKPGYIIYYGKNPQMQNFMLRGKPKESLDASYTDSVMANVRAVIKKNEEKRQGRRTMTAAMVFFAVFLFAGGILILQGNKKLEMLEKTMAVVSDAEIVEKKEKEKREVRSKTSDKGSEKKQTTENLTKDGSDLLETMKPKETTDPAELLDSSTLEAPKETSRPAQKSKKESPKKKTEDVSKTTGEKKDTSSGDHPKKASKKKKTTVQEGSENRKKKEEQTETAVVQHSYIVQKGDTLSSIVWREYRDLAKIPLIKERNRIEDENQIIEGQRLILPVYR